MLRVFADAATARPRVGYFELIRMLLAVMTQLYVL